MDRIELVEKCLIIYGSAIRADWSLIDGRTVRSDLEFIAGLLNGDGEIPSLEYCMEKLGIREGKYSYEWV